MVDVIDCAFDKCTELLTATTEKKGVDIRICHLCTSICTSDDTVFCEKCRRIVVISGEQHYSDAAPLKHESGHLKSSVNLNSAFMYRLRKTALYCSGLKHRDRATHAIFQELQSRMSVQHNALHPSVLEDIKSLYTEVSTHASTYRVRKINLIAACTYEACKRHGVPRSAKEICEIFDIKPKSFSMGCRYFRNAVSDASHVVASPCDFVHRFTSKLGLGRGSCDSVLEKIENLVSEFGKNSIAPQSLAAACICLCNPSLCSKHVSQVCGVSDATITRCIKQVASIVTSPL
jgi:transcription initiation factor TFIIIB Brf1 subunit/transcription initiation factor TFIIB